MPTEANGTSGGIVVVASIVSSSIGIYFGAKWMQQPTIKI
jgi:hypothetical protein